MSLILFLYFYTMDFSKIRLAEPSDIPILADLFVKVTAQMISLSIHQWNYSYPTKEHVANDVDTKTSYVWLENNSIAGTISLDNKQDVQYKSIEWQGKYEEVIVIHRLAIHPDFQGQGISKALCLFAEYIAFLNDVKTIRLDAYSDNPISTNLYARLGYKKAKGYCYFHGNDLPFYCYDKVLTDK